MECALNAEAAFSDGVVRWRVFGDGGVLTVLVHDPPFSSFLWRDVAVALSRRGWRVYVLDLLRYGQSDSARAKA